MDTIVIEVVTGGTAAAADLTGPAAAFVAGKGDGLLSVFVPHATAGVFPFEHGSTPTYS